MKRHDSRSSDKTRRDKINDEVEAAFSAGFNCGRQEQVRRDFPDVGMSFDKGYKHYFDKWIINKKP